VDDAHDPAPPPAGFGLARLLDPVGAREFEDEYWGRRPLAVQGRDPLHYADLLTLDGIDRLLGAAGPGFEGVRVVSRGVEQPAVRPGRGRRHEVANRLDAIYARYRSGSTVVLNAVHERWEPLGRLARRLGAELSAALEMNVYLTPGGRAHALDAHYDTHDVFVAQIHGTKHWKLFGAPYLSPTTRQPFAGRAAEPLDQDTATGVDLRAGDLLYLPRGHIHQAFTGQGSSAHLTIGVHQAQWLDLIEEALEELAAREPRLRGALPLGFASSPRRQDEAAEQLRTLLDVISTGISPREVMEKAVRRAAAVNPPDLRGHLSDLEQLDAVTQDTAVYRRPGARCAVTADAHTVRVECFNKVLELPGRVSAEVAFLTSGGAEGFTAADLPGSLDPAGRLLLVRTFVREGLLTLRPH
jgi:ribosomal protein L16 Arg81 hydroxylase